MKRTMALLSAALVLAACDGNPFGTGGNGGGGGGGGGGTTPGGLTIPENLRGDLPQGNNVRYVKGATSADDRLEVNIMFAGNPQTVRWTRQPSYDVTDPDGRRTYSAFVRQDDALDRAFIGFANESPDGAVRAVVAADGGQFNKLVSGAAYDRIGDFQRPTNSTSGVVSYAGTYAGVNNLPTIPTLFPHPVTLADNTNANTVTLPFQGARVIGKVLINADFNQNKIEGAVYERRSPDIISNATGQGVRFENIILVRSDIAANGTWAGTVERDLRSPNVQERVVGAQGGVIGGAQAQNVAGVVSIEKDGLFWGEEIRAPDGTVLAPQGSLVDPAAVERGIFVIGRCDGSSAAPECSVVNP